MRTEYVTGQLVLHQTLATQHEQRFCVLRVKRCERQQRLQEHARDAKLRERGQNVSARSAAAFLCEPDLKANAQDAHHQRKCVL